MVALKKIKYEWAWTKYCFTNWWNGVKTKWEEK